MSELPGYTPEGDAPTTPEMTIQQLQNTFDAWVVDEYMQRIHTETGATPFARWNDHHLHPRLAPSLESLDVLLMTVPDERKVQQDGVRVFNLLYYATEFCGLTGKRVTVRYDPRDISEVLIYSDDKFVCRATCAELAGKKPSLKEFMKARNAYKRDLKKDIASHVKFASSFPEAQRKIAEPQVSVPVASTKGSRKLRRYQVDE